MALYDRLRDADAVLLALTTKNPNQLVLDILVADFLALEYFDTPTVLAAAWRRGVLGVCGAPPRPPRRGCAAAWVMACSAAPKVSQPTKARSQSTPVRPRTRGDAGSVCSRCRMLQRGLEVDSSSDSAEHAARGLIM